MNPRPDPAALRRAAAALGARAPWRKALGPLPVRSRLHAELLVLLDLDPAVEGVRAARARLEVPGHRPHRPDYEVVTDAGPVLVDVVRADGQRAWGEGNWGDEGAEDFAGADFGAGALPEAAALAQAARALGLGYRQETEGTLRAEPRATTARLVHGCRRARVPVGDRIRVLHALAEAGSLPLIEAAAVARGAPDGVAAVLALVCEGLAALDLDAPLLPESPVRRAALAA